MIIVREKLDGTTERLEAAPRQALAGSRLHAIELNYEDFVELSRLSDAALKEWIGHKTTRCIPRHLVHAKSKTKGCDIYFFADMQKCMTCGESWDANDPYPPLCGRDNPRKVSFVDRAIAWLFGDKQYDNL